MDPRIYVSAHKPYRFPKDSFHVPIQVGTKAAGDLHLEGEKDDQGDNISDRNDGFCELTGIYWVWKNVKSQEPVGFVHYRRYLGTRPWKHTFKDILTKDQAVQLLTTAPVVLPSKRNYFIESVKDQYAHAHHLKDLEVTREILKEKHPDYLPAFDKHMKGTRTHIYNMFLMQRDVFDLYCQWLFDVLFELEKRLDTSSYSVSDARVFGYVGERLLDVWLDTNKIPYTETPVVFLERTNWLKKGSAFLKRKFFGKTQG